MDPQTLSAIVISLGSLAVAIITSRQNRQGAKATNALTERVVDREDFESVMTRLEAENQRMSKRQDVLESRLEEEAKLRAEADARAVAAEQRAIVAEERANRLERRVTQLEDALRQNQIPVPPTN